MKMKFNSRWFKKGHRPLKPFKKGATPWNKGLTKETSEIIKNQGIHHSKIMKGRKLSEEHKQKIRDNAKINPNSGTKGRKMTEETKQKIRQFRIGKKQSKKIREKIRLSHIGKHHNEETKRKMSENHQGMLEKKHSEETKRKISKANKNNPKIKEARAKQILPIKDTTIEVKIQKFLKQLGISFFTHQYMKEIEHGYQCDIFIPFMNLVIECDGNYWHKYPIGNELDIIRRQELLDKGFNVLRFWESEIKQMELNDFENKLEQMNVLWEMK